MLPETELFHREASMSQTAFRNMFDAGQHVSVFSQVTYGDAAEMEAGSNEAAGTVGVNKAQTVDFSRIMVTNSLQELLAATIGIQ